MKTVASANSSETTRKKMERSGLKSNGCDQYLLMRMAEN